MDDLRFLDADGIVNRAAFNERFGALNGLYQYWWRRRIPAYYEIGGKPLQTVYIIATTNPNIAEERYYSNDVEVDQITGKISAQNKQSVSGSYSTGSNFRVLIGKYYLESGGNIWEIPSDQEIKNRIENGYYYVYTQGSLLTPSLVDAGEWEYLTSSEPDAYPKSGTIDGYEYEYLGVPFDNAKAPVRIIQGTYKGTGTYGESNPTSIMLPFQPKLVIITFGGAEWMFWTPGISVTTGSFRDSNMSNIFTNIYGQRLEFWTNGTSATNQMNQSGATYHYLAIG